MKLKRKIDWKAKIVLSILLWILLVIGLLFGATYIYFVNKLQITNKKITYMTFESSEQKLKEMIERTDYSLNQLANNTLVWKSTKLWNEGKKDEAMINRKLIADFDKILFGDKDIYGVALINGEGRTVVSTAEKKSRSGHTVITDEMYDLMRESKSKSPFIVWVAAEKLDIEEESVLYKTLNRPVLLGIKSLNEKEEVEKDSYILITLDERGVQREYAQAIYNDGEVVLMDDEGYILSSTDKNMISTEYKENKKYQNIEYKFSYNGWTLVNMIPKEMYFQEGKKIRNFGIGVAVLMIIAVMIVSGIWSRRYTRPIQYLMDQMESVGKEKLDIPIPEKKGWSELDELNTQFYQMVQRLKEYIAKLQEIEKEKSKEELLALQYQINPHFLYNSLNTIRWIAMMTNSTKVADSIVTLSKIIMPILRDTSFTWKLKDELEFLENYIKIMILRYGDTFEYEMKCNDELMQEEFPRFILQPIIENCFVHGRYEEREKNIVGKIEKCNGRFYISIQNSGSCISVEKLKEINECLRNGTTSGSSIGLINIKKAK